MSTTPVTYTGLHGSVTYHHGPLTITGHDGVVARLKGLLTVTGEVLPWLITHPKNVDAARDLYEKGQMKGLITYLQRLYWEGMGWEEATRALQNIAPAPLSNGVDGLDTAMHSVWLHGDWRRLTQAMTTEEREAAADAVQRYSDHTGALDGPIAGLRWWRE